MQCTICKVNLVSLGIQILAIKIGYCPKCGLVYAQKLPATGGSATASVKKMPGDT